jgi:nitrite reductase/ring-hydroxylating ferredoxin subunit
MPDATPGPDRRTFIQGLLGLLASLAVSRRAAAAGDPEPPPAAAPVQTTETRATLAAGQVRDYRKQGDLFLLADTGGIYALTSICTHRGCSVRWEGEGFVCPCHGSTYDRLGAVTHGPARLPLRHLAVRETEPGAALLVDPAATVPPGTRL